MKLLFTALLLGLIAVPATMVTPTTPQAQQAQDTLQAKRDAAADAVRKQIEGKEALPSSEVYKNIKLLGDMPASRLLSVMNAGYSRNLGVSCDYCHNTDDFSSDEKQEKLTARAMVELAASVTAQLREISSIKSDAPFVNCGTCHRGVARPGVRAPAGE